MISLHFQGKPFSITVIQVYATTTHAEEAELDQFCWDLEDLLELTHTHTHTHTHIHTHKDVLFIIENRNANVGSQEILGVTGKFGLGEQNKAGQRLTEFCQKTHKKDILFIIGDWNAKVGSQEIPGVTGKFGLGEQNEAG